MKLVEKGRDGAEPVHMSWDAAQAALASGAYDVAPDGRERDGDQPAAQSPAPGTAPKDGEEKAAEGQVLTNMAPVTAAGIVSDGLPKSPTPPEPAAVKNPPTPTLPADPAKA